MVLVTVLIAQWVSLPTVLIVAGPKDLKDNRSIKEMSVTSREL